MTADELAAVPPALLPQLHDLDEMQHPELVAAEYQLTGRRRYGATPNWLRRTAHRLHIAGRRTLRRAGLR